MDLWTVGYADTRLTAQARFPMDKLPSRYVDRPLLAGCVSTIRRSVAVAHQCQKYCPLPYGQTGKTFYPQILWINL